MLDTTASFDTTALSVQTTDQEDTLPPAWLPEVLLMAQLWRASSLVTRLQQQVRPERGRMGHYLEATNFRGVHKSKGSRTPRP